MATNQAKWAIEKMKAAGWARNEYSVRTEISRPTASNGTRYTEYGEANIHMKAPKARQVEMLGAMIKAGLKVTLIIGHRPMSILVSDRYDKAPLTIMDMLAEDYTKRWIRIPVALDLEAK